MPSGNLNLLSIDIEEWYLSYDSSQITPAKWPLLESRVEQSTRIFLSLLKKHRQKASFFVLGWVAEHHPGLIREIAEAGHEIGYHSNKHELPANQGPEAFEADLLYGLNLLESITGKRPVQYRAPMFSLCHKSAWAIPLLMKHGIEISSSYKAYQHIIGHNIPNTPFWFEHHGKRLLELPLNRLNLPLLNWVYTGSGYFRLLPKSIIRQLFRSSKYNMAYFHPRDFDTQVPSTPLLPAYRNKMNRIGNSTTAGKLEMLLNDMKFHSLGDGAALLNGDQLKVIGI
ncbi:MAG: polysaccharide deacetylase family protein [Bacteroidales bacterium]|nr:polysaccharide deacetylase family protein [Bacteroidales bacterium]